MALLASEIKVIWDTLYRLGQGKEEIKANQTPSRIERAAIFDVINDFWEDNRASLKADMDTAAGFTLTNAAAKKYGKAWLRWKWGGE